MTPPPGCAPDPQRYKPAHRHPVVRVAEHGPRGEELVEREAAVEDIAAGEPEITLEIERASERGVPSTLARKFGAWVDRRRSSGRRPRRAHRPMYARPRPAAGRDGRAGRRGLRRASPGGASESSTTDGISTSTIGAVGPAARLRIEVSALHVGERRRDDDAAAVMRLRCVRPGSAVKVGQLGERDVHPERAGSASVTGDARAEILRQMLRRDEPLEQHFRRDVGHDALCVDHFAALELDAALRGRPSRSRARPAPPCATTTPRAAHSFAIACVIAPMPPSAWPQSRACR